MKKGYTYLFSSALLLPSSFLKDAAFLAPAGWVPPDLVVPAPARPVRPVTDERIGAALALLEATETGRMLTEAMRGNGTAIRFDPDAYAHYLDGSDSVELGGDFLAGADGWQVAVILAHELEHARQRHLGLAGRAHREARELGAFLVQCRVWVELGGLVRERDLKGNRMNSRDMTAWAHHPRSAMAALSIRADLAQYRSTEGRAYLKRVLADEAEWRRRHEVPRDRDSRAAALFVLKQAAGFPGLDQPSGWLPAYLESEATGPFPGAPSAFDLVALTTLDAPR